jgi:glycosyltransferase involved in cell wall biosynthesis
MSGATRPLVSVVIPFLNSEAFLADAVDSVVRQTVQRWELLLVDDGSIDRSAEIARAAAARDGRITYLTHAGGANLGPAASRNAGIAAAQASLITFLDADDVWAPGKLAEQIKALETEPRAAAIFGPTEYWRSWHTDQPEPDYIPALGVEPGLVEPPDLLVLSLRSLARTPGPSNILVRREALEQIGGFEEMQELGMYEDQAFLAKLFLRFPVLVTDRCWDRYRLHPGQRSVGRPFAEKRRAALVYFDWLDGYLRENGSRDPELARALSQKRRRYRFPVWNRTFLRMRRLKESLRPS